MTTDALIARDGKLATITDETMAQLNEFLPICWSHGNPVDVLGDAPPDRFAKAVEIVLKDKDVDAVLVILTPQAMTDPTATAAGGGQGGQPRPQAGAGGLDGRPRGGRGHPDCSTRPASPPTTRRRRRSARSCTWFPTPAICEILHETPQGHSAGVHARSPAAARRVRHDSHRGGRDPLGERLEGVPGGLRDSGHQAAGGPHGRRGGRSGPSHRLSGGAEDPLAADHAQDRRGRRDAEPGLRREGPRRPSSEITKPRQGEAARRRDRRRDRAEDGHLSEQLRADHGHEEGPGLRRGDHGGHGRRGGRGVPRPGVGPAAVERGPGPADARIAQVVAAVAGLSRQARRQHRPADRDHHAVLLPRGRLSRDQGVGHQPAAGHARGRRSRWTPAW